MLAVDLEGAGEADRDLGDTGEVLDVPLGDLRVEGVLVDVLELVSGELLDELLPGSDDLRGEVVLLLGGDAVALDALGDGILDLEGEGAEGLGIERESDLVLPLVELVAAGVDADHAGERERDGAGRSDRCTLDAVAVELEREPVGGYGAAVDADLVEPGHGGVAEPVLQAELHAVLDVLETPQRVHLLEDEGRNLHIKDLVTEGWIRWSISRTGGGAQTMLS
jgi:hypothetical protein